MALLLTLFSIVFTVYSVYSIEYSLQCLSLPSTPPPMFPPASPDHQPLWQLAVLLRHRSHRAAASNNVSYAVNRQTPPNGPAGNFDLHHSHTLWWPPINSKSSNYRQGCAHFHKLGCKHWDMHMYTHGYMLWVYMHAHHVLFCMLAFVVYRWVECFIWDVRILQ